MGMLLYEYCDDDLQHSVAVTPQKFSETEDKINRIKTTNMKISLTRRTFKCFCL